MSTVAAMVGGHLSYKQEKFNNGGDDSDMLKCLKCFFLIIVIAALIMGSSAVSADNTELILNQTFEGDADILKSKQWYVSDSGVNVVNSPTFDGKVLAISPIQYAAYTLESAVNSGTVTVSVDFFVKELVNSRPISLWDEKNTTGNSFVRIETDTSGKISAVNSEAEKIFVGMYSLNKWTNITLLINNENSTYKVFINGCESSDNISFSSSNRIVNGINTIEFQNGSNESDIYIDNLYIKRSNNCDFEKIISNYTKYMQRIDCSFEGLSGKRIEDTGKYGYNTVFGCCEAYYTDEGGNTYIHFAGNESVKCNTDRIKDKKYFVISYDFRSENIFGTCPVKLYDDNGNVFSEIYVDVNGDFNINKSVLSSPGISGQNWNNMYFVINFEENRISAYLNGISLKSDGGNNQIDLLNNDAASVCEIEFAGGNNTSIDIDNISANGFGNVSDAEMYIYMSLCRSDRSVMSMAEGYLKLMCGHDVAARLCSENYKKYENAVNEHKNYRKYADFADAVYAENFDSFADGYIFDNSKGNTVAEYAVVDSGTLKIGGENEKGRFLKYKRQFEDLTINFDFKQSKKIPGKIYSLSDSAGKKNVMFITCNGYDIKLESGSDDAPIVILKNYEVDRWYNIKIITSVSNKSFALFIDGNKIGDYKFLNSDINNFERVFDVADIGCAFYDNVEILKYYDIKPIALGCGKSVPDSGEMFFSINENEVNIPKELDHIFDLRIAYGWKSESGILLLSLSGNTTPVSIRLYDRHNEDASLISIEEKSDIEKIDIYYWEHLQTLVPISKKQQINIKRNGSE